MTTLGTGTLGGGTLGTPVPAWHPSYTSIDLSENSDSVITGVTVVAAQSETTTASRTLADVMVRHEEVLNPDVPATAGDVSAYALSFPLRGATSLMPSAMTSEADDAFLAQLPLEPGELIAIQYAGREYDAGIASISYSFTPERALVAFGLLPGYVLKFESVARPSVVRNLKAVALPGASVGVRLTWTAPAWPGGDFIGYQINYRPGTGAPSLDTGLPIASLGPTVTSFDHTDPTMVTGRTYAYSIFPLTSNPAVVGDKATIIGKAG